MIEPASEAPRGAASHVDVVILCWNEPDGAAGAIASALASQGVSVRVVLIDNGSEVPVADSDDERVMLIRNDVNRGVAGGRNQGVAASKADLVAFLDGDARLERHCLATLANAMSMDDGIGMAVPVFQGQPPETSAGDLPSLVRKVVRGLRLTRTYSVASRKSLEDGWQVGFAIGACQLIRRRAFDDVDGLDDSYLFGPDDIEFSRRLVSKGWKIVQMREAMCEHVARRAHRNPLSRRGLAHAWALARFYARHPWGR